MSILIQWLEYLDRNRVRYSHSFHAPAQTALGTAGAKRIPPHDLAKPVVYHGDTGFGIAVVAADERVDLLEVARLCGISYIGLAPEETLTERFPEREPGAEPGADPLAARKINIIQAREKPTRASAADRGARPTLDFSKFKWY